MTTIKNIFTLKIFTFCSALLGHPAAGGAGGVRHLVAGVRLRADLGAAVVGEVVAAGGVLAGVLALADVVGDGRRDHGAATGALLRAVDAV